MVLLALGFSATNAMRIHQKDDDIANMLSNGDLEATIAQAKKESTDM